MNLAEIEGRIVNGDNVILVKFGYTDYIVDLVVVL